VKKEKRRTSTVKIKYKFEETSNEVVARTGEEDFKISIQLIAELVKRRSLHRDLCVEIDFDFVMKSTSRSDPRVYFKEGLE